MLVLEVQTNFMKGTLMDQIIKTPKNIINQGSDFLQFIELQKELTSQIEAAWHEIQTTMLDHDVSSIKGDWGYISVAERRNWKATDLPPRFYKQTLDTARLNSMFKLGDAIPKGASFTTTNYLAKRIK